MQFDDLTTYGVAYHKYETDDIAFLTDEVDEILNDFSIAPAANDRLIGHMDHEYFLSDSCIKQFEQKVLPLINGYSERYSTFFSAKYNSLASESALYLKDLWVNFQKKNEYNPVHDHGGVFSFVLWLKIPYTREEEDAVSFTQKLSKDALTSNGKFEFFFIDTLGGIYSHKLPIDSSFENVIMLFPSSMKHCVYPFYTSDEYRISVSGNFYLKPV